MMAHNALAPSPDGKGVSFSVTKAKGEHTFPDTVWGVAEFEIRRLVKNKFLTRCAMRCAHIRHFFTTPQDSTPPPEHFTLSEGL